MLLGSIIGFALLHGEQLPLKFCPNFIRLIMPPFTEERRKEYVKQVKKIGEDAKIAVRNVRREGNDLLKKLEKEKAISQDEEKASQTNIQQVTDEHIRIIDDLIGTKEKELMSL